MAVTRIEINSAEDWANIDFSSLQTATSSDPDIIQLDIRADLDFTGIMYPTFNLTAGYISILGNGHTIKNINYYSNLNQTFRLLPAQKGFQSAQTALAHPLVENLNFSNNKIIIPNGSFRGIDLSSSVESSTYGNISNIVWDSTN